MRDAFKLPLILVISLLAVSAGFSLGTVELDYQINNLLEVEGYYIGMLERFDCNSLEELVRNESNSYIVQTYTQKCTTTGHL